MPRPRRTSILTMLIPGVAPPGLIQALASRYGRGTTTRARLVEAGVPIRVPGLGSPFAAHESTSKKGRQALTAAAQSGSMDPMSADILHRRARSVGLIARNKIGPGERR